MNRFPVILLDINNKPVPLNAAARSNSFFIRATQRFNISISEASASTNLIYSVTLKDPPTGQDTEGLFNIIGAKSFTGMANYGYTLFIESDCVLLYSGVDGIERSVTIAYVPDNVLTPQQEQYNDLLVNNRLPTYEELVPGYIGSNPADMIKRLLLDFKVIMRDKGKKSGIEKFLEFIGFDPTSIVVTDEYKTPSGAITTSPNTLVDVKTGNYHLLFDNWTTDPNNPFTDLNMPLRVLTVTDLTDFFKKLFYALALANVYFTLPEQNINFFGVVDSANGPRFMSVAGVVHQTYKHLVHRWRKDVHINIYEMYVSTGPHTWIVYDTIQRQTSVDKSAAITYGQSPDFSDEIYTVPQQIYLDQEITPDMDPTLIEQVFSNVLHLQLTGPLGYFWMYSIVNSVNPMVSLAPVNRFIFDNEGEDGLGHDEVIVVTNMNGTYKVKITVWDLWNNKDEWDYEYVISDVSAKIDIEAFDSSQVASDIENLPGTLHTEISVSEGNTDLSSTGSLIVLGAAGGSTELPLNAEGDTGVQSFPTTQAPFTILSVGNQATSFQLKVNGTVYEIPAFDNPTAQPLVYSNDDGEDLVLNDGTDITTNDPLSFILESDGLNSGFGNLSKNVYLQAWFVGQPEPIYVPLTDDSAPIRDNTILGDIDLDVDSPWQVSAATDNYVLPSNLVPTDLSQYYGVGTTGTVLKYLFHGQKYIATGINKNFGMDLATSTIPADFMDPWIEVVAVKYVDGQTLKMRKTDELFLVPVVFDYFNTAAYGSIPDKLFVTAMDIAEDPTDPSTIDAWIFISTMEPGINLGTDLFDLVLEPDGYSGAIADLPSIYDIPQGSGMQRVRLPVNYDFPLFFRPSTLLPNFVNYPPMAGDPTNFVAGALPIIRSIWPRLYRVGTDTIGGSQVLLLGDLFICRFDQRYVANAKDIQWTVKNSFTGGIIFQTSDYMLKYRVNENAVYDVALTFMAGMNGNYSPYTITKKALFSSFTYSLDAAAV
jgi:hypothetical protein